MKRFYRYDFAVTSLFSELGFTYYGIAVSAHILSYTPTSVVQLLSTTEKPFFVDPMTFVFAREQEAIARNGRMRKSYSKLMHAYGPPFSECDNGRQLSPSQFKDQGGQPDDTTIRNACQRILSYQVDGLRAAASLAKYMTLLKKGVPLRMVSPSFLLTPYFFFLNTRDEWYKIALRFAQISQSLKGEKELYAVLCLARDMLYEPVELRRLISDYAGYDGYFIWVDGLREEVLGSDDLAGLKNLIQGLASYGKPVYSLYGGYVCDLLSKFGLTGYSSGICYGESRRVDTRGGGAGNRYYIRHSHLKISEELAEAFYGISDKNLRLLCSCPTCEGIRARLPEGLDSQRFSDNFFTAMDFLDFRRHFMYSKQLETTALDTMTNEEVLAALDRDVEQLANIDPFIGQPEELYPLHLRRWRSLFVPGS